MLGLIADITGILSFIMSIAIFFVSHSLLRDMAKRQQDYNSKRIDIQSDLIALRDNIWKDHLDNLEIRSRLRQALYSYRNQYWLIAFPFRLYHIQCSLHYIKGPIKPKNKERLCNHKDNSLCWVRYCQSQIELKPLPPSPLDDGPFNIANSFALLSKGIDTENSYVCHYNQGYFFLLLYDTLLQNSLTLRVQTDSAEYSRIYLSTSDTDDVNVVAQLKRLYNLISSHESTQDVDNFINSFINGE